MLRKVDGGRDAAVRRKNTDLKLLSQLRGITLRIHPQHLFVSDCKLIHQDGRLAAQAGLQNGVVDEDVLLLKARRVTQFQFMHAVGFS